MGTAAEDSVGVVGRNIVGTAAGNIVGTAAGDIVRAVGEDSVGAVRRNIAGAVDLDQLYLYHLQSLMERTERALEAGGFDALVIHSGRPPVQFLDDQDYPYKVNPHFKAWVPVVDNPDCFLVYRPGSRPLLLFNQPNDYWHQAAALPTAPWTTAWDVIAVAEPAQTAAHWAGLGRVALIGPDNRAFVGPDSAAAEPESVNNPDLLKRMHYERAVKTDYEIECLRRATALAVRGHRAALAAFRSGASEYDAHLHYLEACVQREEELPYNSIVAYNEHAAVLHYQHLARRPPTPLRSFLIDAGAQYRGYAADITRTYAASPGRFAELIEAADRAQRRICGEIIAGRDYREVHLSAHRILGDAMHEIGLTKVSGDDAFEARITGVFFPHGIGHLLGLQVHDVGGVMADVAGAERERPPGHPYLRLTRMLEPGVVVTVEPGIYFIDSLLKAANDDAARSALIDWTVVDELRPFGGVRIEDNVAATAGTPENLTRDAFERAARQDA